MHAFLIVGGSTEKRQQELLRRLTDWRVARNDVVILACEGEHITIDEVRAFQKRLLLAPQYSPFTVGIIHDAHLLTLEAQQALLKLLEEPPPHAYLMSEAETEHQLLATIVSRCQIIRLADMKNDSSTKTMQAIKTLLKAAPGDIMREVDTHTTERTQAKQWTRELTIGARELMLTDPSEKIVRLVRRLLQASAQLSVNCNPKLVLDRVFLSL